MARGKLAQASRFVEFEVLEALVADVVAVCVTSVAVCIGADLTLAVSKVAQEEALGAFVAYERTLRLTGIALVNPASRIYALRLVLVFEQVVARLAGVAPISAAGDAAGAVIDLAVHAHKFVHVAHCLI